MTAVLGDFLRPAQENIAAAVASRWPPAGSVPAVARELSRVIAALGTCLGSIAVPDEGGMRLAGAGAAQETARIRLTLQWSALALRQAAEGSGQPGPANGTSACLAAAADQLGGGGDLLRACRSPAVMGRPGSAPALAGVTYWAAVASSAPVSAALLAEIRGHARTLAPWTARLAEAAAGTPAWTSLHDAARWLYAAAGSAAAGQQDEALPSGSSAALHGLPVPLLPPRRRPHEPERDADLCAGIIDTAARLRHAAVEFLPLASSSPAANSVSWRRNALAMSIAAHASSLILGKVARRARALGADAALRRKLAETQAAAVRASARQRLLTAGWDSITTGARPLAEVTPVADEIDDLVLRIGRLAYDHPRWAPGIANAGPERHPAKTARTPEDIAAVLSALHHAADAMAVVTAADRQSVREAARGGRLYCLAARNPGSYATPYPYLPVTQAQATRFLAGYTGTARSATSLVAALDELACTLGTPSAILAVPRREPLPPPGGHLDQPDLVTGPVAAPRAGQVRTLLGRMRITERTLLTRAELADAAAVDLLAEAATVARRRQQSFPGLLHGQATRRP